MGRFAEESASVASKGSYHRLAELMSWDPNLAIFPRFKTLNNLVLLKAQSEITDLEEQLFNSIKLDQKSSIEERNRLSLNWSLLETSVHGKQQHVLYEKLEQKLLHYNQHMVYQSILNDRPSPQLRDIAFLRNWLANPEEGASSLRGPGCLNWETQEDGGRPLTDHISLDSSQAMHRSLTRNTFESLLPIIRRLPRGLVKRHTFDPEQGDKGVTIYSTSDTLKSFADKVASLTAAILILVPVIILHFVSNANTRLVIVVVSTLAFNGLLSLATDAKRSEVFAATAAFVAVQVVYIGSVLQSPA